MPGTRLRAMQAVILGIHPRANVVDITHEIPPGDIRAGAFALMASCRHFPRGMVHVAVVDPGVGSQPRAIAVRTADRFLVGPDSFRLHYRCCEACSAKCNSASTPSQCSSTISRNHGNEGFLFEKNRWIERRRW